MKKLLLFISIVFVAATIATAQGSVSIAATNGGSVTLTPEGVTRSTPTPIVTRGIAASKPKPVVAPVIKPVEGKITTYAFTGLDVAQARMIFNAYRGVRDDESATKEDLATADALRKFIIENKDFTTSKKTIDVNVPAEKVDRVFSNGWYHNRKELQRQLQQLDVEEKLYKMAMKQETDAKIPEQDSKLRFRKDRFDQ